MNDRQPNALLDAVDDLTLPRRTKVMQDDKTVTVVLPALLERLDASIRSTIGIGGSGSLANERNMLNNDALHRFTIINSAVRDWCRLVDVEVRPPDKPWTLLRRWYTAYTLRNPELESERFYLGQLTKWANEIEATFDPPKQHDLPNACPLCNATAWTNEADGLAYGRPLIIQYKQDAADLVGEAKGLCRACKTVWGARELAYAIEEKEQETA